MNNLQHLHISSRIPLKHVLILIRIIEIVIRPRSIDNLQLSRDVRIHSRDEVLNQLIIRRISPTQLLLDPEHRLFVNVFILISDLVQLLEASFGAETSTATIFSTRSCAHSCTLRHEYGGGATNQDPRNTKSVSAETRLEEVIWSSDFVTEGVLLGPGQSKKAVKSMSRSSQVF